MSKRLDPNLVLRYVTGKAGDEERCEVECAVAESDECLHQVRGALLLRQHFETIMDMWTAENVGRVARGEAPVPSGPSVLRVAFDAGERVIGSAGAESVLGLTEDWVTTVREALRLPPAQRGAAFRRVVREEDLLYPVAAGEAAEPESSVIETTPIWFTNLLEPPRILSWRTAHEGLWQARMWTLDGGDLLDERTSGSSVPLPLESIPKGVNVRWEVKEASDDRGVRCVRGIFRVLVAEEAEAAVRKLAEIEKSADDFGLETELLSAQYQLDAGFYDRIVTRMRSLTSENGRTDGPAQFALLRILASTFTAIYRNLVKKRLGDPEGLWAAAMARAYTERAYHLVQDVP